MARVLLETDGLDVNAVIKERLPVRLVVVEHGASMPSPSTSHESQADELDVFVLPDADSPSDLALRVLRQIAAIERSGQHIRSAVIAAAGDGGGQSLAARCLIARAMVAHQMGRGSGELVLTSRAVPGRRVQNQLLALAGALTVEAGASDVSIRVLIDVAPEAEVAQVPRPPVSIRHDRPMTCCAAGCGADCVRNYSV